MDGCVHYDPGAASLCHEMMNRQRLVRWRRDRPRMAGGESGAVRCGRAEDRRWLWGNDFEEEREKRERERAGGLFGEGDEACSSGFLSLM